MGSIRCRVLIPFRAYNPGQYIWPNGAERQWLIAKGFLVEDPEEDEKKVRSTKDEEKKPEPEKKVHSTKAEEPKPKDASLDTTAGPVPAPTVFTRRTKKTATKKKKK